MEYVYLLVSHAAMAVAGAMFVLLRQTKPVQPRPELAREELRGRIRDFGEQFVQLEFEQNGRPMTRSFENPVLARVASPGMPLVVEQVFYRS